jgi:hypothetical protein
MVRDDDKHPEPYKHTDFLINWNEVWDIVGNPPAELTEEEEFKRSEALLGKVININTWFGGTTKQ